MKVFGSSLMGGRKASGGTSKERRETSWRKSITQSDFLIVHFTCGLRYHFYPVLPLLAICTALLVIHIATYSVMQGFSN